MDHSATGQETNQDIPVYLADSIQESGGWLLDAMPEATHSDITVLHSIEELALHTRELVFQDDPLPFLAVITTPEIDEQLLERCHRFLRLADQGWLGIVLAVYGTAPDNETVTQAIQQGCIDVVQIRKHSTLDREILRRLQLSMQILLERRKRLQQETYYNARLAENRVVEARLHYLAQHDELTNLANRDSFEKGVNEAICVGNEKQLTHALLYLDLDRFKLHNDAAGHESGNTMLQQVANHLRSAMPAEYLLARLGSDEFAILMQNVDDAKAMHEAEILRAVVSNIEPDGEDIIYHVGISIGMALIQPGKIETASQALAQAEQACYVAKTRGGNAVHQYSQDDDVLQHMRDDMHWTKPIREALNQGQFFLAFQPILDLHQQSIHHFEALVRIPSSLGGDENSARFMLAAERLGMAQQIDLWVVNKAIDYLATHDEISLGINLSCHAFQENTMMQLLQDKLRGDLIDPQRLTFEITETSAILSFADTRRVVSQLRELGCRFALDDFGSGFSTYHYLKQFPIDVLKIDGSFIIHLKDNPQDQAIVQSMIDIAHSLDKEVVAEFIEDAETLAILEEMGIDHAQGYYIGKPSRIPVIRHGWQVKEIQE